MLEKKQMEVMGAPKEDYIMIGAGFAKPLYKLWSVPLNDFNGAVFFNQSYNFQL
jgi:hypothetical protein